MEQKLLITQKLLLLVAGALLTLIGTLIIASPGEFFAANQIELGPNPSLLNELKAPAGLLLAAGIYMLGAVFARGLADTATALAALVYLSYAAARALSMGQDGMPAAGLVQAAALEAVIGLACVALLVYRRATALEAAS